jgi:chromosomal replication initiation ATPase DnaA
MSVSTRADAGPSLARVAMTPDDIIASLGADLREQELLPLVERIALEHHVTADAVLGRGKTATVARARRAVMVALRGMGFSYPEVGRLIDRDPSTVMAACGARQRRAA